MTREEFIAVLRMNGYYYKMEGDKIIVTYGGHVWLDGLKTLPPGVEFKNRGNVHLGSLETIPPGVEFKNRGDVKIKGLDWVEDNGGIRIEGVENKMLVNLMIKQGVFI